MVILSPCSQSDMEAPWSDPMKHPSAAVHMRSYHCNWPSLDVRGERGLWLLNSLQSLASSPEAPSSQRQPSCSAGWRCLWSLWGTVQPQSEEANQVLLLIQGNRNNVRAMVDPVINRLRGHLLARGWIIPPGDKYKHFSHYIGEVLHIILEPLGS